jgi:CBS domain-containing protein
MTVKTVLSGKPPGVLTIAPDETLAVAAKMLAERRIGALVVLGPDQRVSGILSERDIIHCFATYGTAAFERRVEDAMTRKVVTCSQSDTVASIMEQMTSGKFRHLPVVEQGRLIGIISIGDVVKYRLGEMEREQNALKEYILTA